MLFWLYLAQGNPKIILAAISFCSPAVHYLAYACIRLLTYPNHRDVNPHCEPYIVESATRLGIFTPPLLFPSTTGRGGAWLVIGPSRATYSRHKLAYVSRSSLFRALLICYTTQGMLFLANGLSFQVHTLPKSNDVRSDTLPFFHPRHIKSPLKHAHRDSPQMAKWQERRM